MIEEKPIDKLIKTISKSSKADKQEKVEAFRSLMEDGSAKAIRAMAIAMIHEAPAFYDYAEIIKPLDREGIEDLWEMIRDDKQNDRHGAAVALSCVEHPYARNVLWRILECVDDDCRAQAMIELGYRPNPEMAEVVAGYLEDEDYTVRKFAIRYLGDCRKEKYLEEIRKATEVNDPDMQVEAATALAKLGDDEGFTMLRRISESEPDTLIRAYAAAALVRMGDKEAIDILFSFAESCECSCTRTISEGVLRGLGLR